MNNENNKNKIKNNIFVDILVIVFVILMMFLALYVNYRLVTSDNSALRILGWGNIIYSGFQFIGFLLFIGFLYIIMRQFNINKEENTS